MSSPKGGVRFKGVDETLIRNQIYLPSKRGTRLTNLTFVVIPRDDTILKNDRTNRITRDVGALEEALP